jgi:hypothetical protein
MKFKYVVTVALSLFMFSSTALAQVTIQRPPGDKLNFEIAPGTSVNHSITVVNLKDQPIDIELYVTDGVITESGSFSALGKYAERKYMGKWVTFEKPKIHLEANEQKKTAFTISIPAAITPGSFAGAICLEPALPPVKLPRTGAIVSTRIAIPLFVKVSGKKTIDYTWTDFSHNFDAAHQFLFSFTNDGNTIIKIDGEITLRNFYGDPVIIPVAKILLLQKEKNDIVIPWKDKPFFGLYTATASLNFTEFNLTADKYIKLETRTKTMRFTVIPWGTIIFVLALIILSIATMVIRKISHKRFLKKCVTYQVASGETLTGIAKKNTTDWRLLAKINNIKPPFDLSPGQKILLPRKK